MTTSEAKKVRSRLYREIDHAEDPSIDERALVRLFETVEQTLLPEYETSATLYSLVVFFY